MISKTMHIGLDDTDSTKRGCTTYIAALLVEKLLKINATFIDYPNLIRLNPNVPWKTRGNGALCLRINFSEIAEAKVEETVVSTVEEQADLKNQSTDPGIVFFSQPQIPSSIQAFAANTITGISTVQDAKRLLRKFNGEAIAFKNGRGIIGALAAVGEMLQLDHTYEIIAYRTQENWGSKRRVNEASIFEMDQLTRPNTFNNVDTEKNRAIITPRGADPILFGIRGETPTAVSNAFRMVKVMEPIERWIIFRTNQGTDMHLKRVKSLKQIKPYSPIVAKAIVSKNPRMLRGKHVIFSVKDESREIDCAAYEPTGTLRKIANELLIGDNAEIYGGARPPAPDRPLTLNLEKIRLLRLAPRVFYRNPICSICGKRLKSMGTHKGFRCEACGSKFTSLNKVEVKTERNIAEGLYMTSTRSQRHLTKPFIRYGKEKHHGLVEAMIEGWHFP